MVSRRPRAAAIAVLVPTPSVEDTITGSRYPSGIVIADPNPPRPPSTSGRRVDSTEARISATARSPAATSTPGPRVGGAQRDRSLGHPRAPLPTGTVSRRNLRALTSYGTGSG